MRVVGQWSGHILLCASGGNLTRAHFHRRCLAAADRPLPLPLPRCRTCSARRLAAGLSHPASGRAGMRRVGGRRRSSVSDRANASVVPAGEVTDEQAATRQLSGGWQRARAIAPVRCGLRTVAPPPPMPRGHACIARIAPTCTVLPPSVREVGRSRYFCNGFWPAPGSLCSTRPLCLTSSTNAPASVTRTRLRLSDRANVHRAAAPIGGAAACAQLL